MQPRDPSEIPAETTVPGSTAPGVTLPGATTAGAAVRAGQEPDEVHVLRLCLDLTLDAMLLALGAAAADPAPQPVRAPGTPADGVPVTGHGGVRRTGPAGVSWPVPTPTASPLSGPLPTGAISAGTLPADAVPAGTGPTGAVPGRPVPAGSVTVGSAAQEPTPPEPEPSEPGPTGSEPDPVRWQRWLREDVEQARFLAAELLDRGGGLPAWLATARASGSSAEVVARLESFHAQTQALLAELELTLGADPAAADRIGTAQVQTAVRHVRRRLGELELLRLDLQSARVPAVTVPSGLPGEFLG